MKISSFQCYILHAAPRLDHLAELQPHHLLPDQISSRSYVGSVCRMRSLAEKDLRKTAKFLQKCKEVSGNDGQPNSYTSEVFGSVTVKREEINCTCMLLTRWRRRHNPRRKEEPEWVETSSREKATKAYQGSEEMVFITAASLKTSKETLERVIKHLYQHLYPLFHTRPNCTGVQLQYKTTERLCCCRCCTRTTKSLNNLLNRKHWC